MVRIVSQKSSADRFRKAQRKLDRDIKRRIEERRAKEKAKSSSSGKRSSGGGSSVTISNGNTTEFKRSAEAIQRDINVGNISLAKGQEVLDKEQKRLGVRSSNIKLSPSQAEKFSTQLTRNVSVIQRELDAGNISLTRARNLAKQEEERLGRVFSGVGFGKNTSRASSVRIGVPVTELVERGDLSATSLVGLTKPDGSSFSRAELEQLRGIKRNGEWSFEIPARASRTVPKLDVPKIQGTKAAKALKTVVDFATKNLFPGQKELEFSIEKSNDIIKRIIGTKKYNEIVKVTDAKVREKLTVSQLQKAEQFAGLSRGEKALVVASVPAIGLGKGAKFLAEGWEKFLFTSKKDVDEKGGLRGLGLKRTPVTEFIPKAIAGVATLATYMIPGVGVALIVSDLAKNAKMYISPAREINRNLQLSYAKYRKDTKVGEGERLLTADEYYELNKSTFANQIRKTAMIGAAIDVAALNAGSIIKLFKKGFKASAKSLAKIPKNKKIFVPKNNIKGIKVSKQEFKSFQEGMKELNKQKAYNKIATSLKKTKTAFRSEQITGKSLTSKEKSLLAGLKGTPKSTLSKVKAVDTTVLVSELKTNVPTLTRIGSGKTAIWKFTLTPKTLYQNTISYGLIGKSGKHLGSVTLSSLSSKPITKFKSISAALKYGKGKQVLFSQLHGKSYVSSTANKLDKRLKQNFSEFISRVKSTEKISTLMDTKNFGVDLKMKITEFKVITKKVLGKGKAKQKFTEGQEIARGKAKARTTKEIIKDTQKKGVITISKKKEILKGFRVEKIKRIKADVGTKKLSNILKNTKNRATIKSKAITNFEGQIKTLKKKSNIIRNNYRKDYAKIQAKIIKSKNKNEIIKLKKKLDNEFFKTQNAIGKIEKQINIINSKIIDEEVRLGIRKLEFMRKIKVSKVKKMTFKEKEAFLKKIAKEEKVTKTVNRKELLEKLSKQAKVRLQEIERQKKLLEEFPKTKISRSDFLKRLQKSHSTRIKAENSIKKALKKVPTKSRKEILVEIQKKYPMTESKRKLIDKVSKEITNQRKSLKLALAAESVTPKIAIRGRIVGFKALQKEAAKAALVRSILAKIIARAGFATLSKTAQARLLANLKALTAIVKKATDSITATKQLSQTATKQVTKKVNETVTRTTNDIVTILPTIPTEIITEKEKTKLRLKIPKFKIKRIIKEKARKPEEVYDVYIRIKGKMVKTNKLPLSDSDSKDRLAYLVDNSTNVTAKRIKAGKATKLGKITSKEKGAFKKAKLRNYKIVKGKRVSLKNTYIERKGKPRINTRGEKQGLSAAKVLAQLKPKKKTVKKKTKVRQRVVKRKKITKRKVKKR